MKKQSKQSFAQGKDAWASTLKSSAQSRGVLGRTSQNRFTEKQQLMLRNNNGRFPKVRDYKKEAVAQLGRAMRGLK